MRLTAVSTTGPVSSRPVKVLFYYLDYGAIGGIERYILETAACLKERGLVEPVVVCSAGGWLQKQAEEQGLQTYGVHSASFFAGSVWRMLDVSALVQLGRILSEVRPDVVHVHIGLLENVWIRLMGYPVAYSAHGYSTLYSLEGVTNPVKLWCKRLIRLLFRKTAKAMDALLFVSESERQRMLAEGFIEPQQHSAVVHNGIDLESWRKNLKAVDATSVKSALGIPETARVVSFVNRLDPIKNPLQFVAMAKQLLSEPDFQDVHFLMAGDGPLMGLVRLQALGTEQIQVLGHYANVIELMAISDLLLYPSLKEGFGLGLLEAMAVGKPCLAYASGGATELLDTPETESCLVPAGDLDILTEKSKALLAAPDAQKSRLIQALQQRANDFDLSVMLEKLETAYRQLHPPVSVILPVYQGEETILRAVSSVLKQGYANLELIVVDDGSTDNTVSLLETIQDPRLKILRQANQGVAAARNYAFSTAQGDYIAFIDADDIWLPQKLEEELKIVQAQRKNGIEACMVYSSYYASDENSRLVNLPKMRQDNGDVAQTTLEDEGLFLPSTTLIHRSVFEALGGFQSGCYHEDRVFFIQAAQKFPAFSTGQRLVIYQQSITGRCRRILSDYEQAVQAELSVLDTLQGQLPNDALECLKQRQLLNLSNRFLMYGFIESAKKTDALLSNQIQRAGLKGQLAQLSLRTGINFLAVLRLCIQQGVYPLMTPWWVLKVRSLNLPAVSPSSNPVQTGVIPC